MLKEVAGVPAVELAVALEPAVVLELALVLELVLELGALRAALGRVVLDQVEAVLKTPTVVLRALQVRRALGTRSRPVLTGFPARVEDARVGVAVAKTPQAKHAAGAALTSGPNIHWEAEARRQPLIMLSRAHEIRRAEPPFRSRFSGAQAG